jgi:hypothetical protein
MSRITITTPPPYAYGVVGYDPPLGTFFAQLYRQRGARRRASLVRWVGTDLQELPTIDALVQALADVMPIPAAIQQQLLHDQQASGFRPNFGVRVLQSLRAARQEETS